MRGERTPKEGLFFRQRRLCSDTRLPSSIHPQQERTKATINAQGIGHRWPSNAPGHLRDGNSVIFLYDLATSAEIGITTNSASHRAIEFLGQQGTLVGHLRDLAAYKEHRATGLHTTGMVGPQMLCAMPARPGAIVSSHLGVSGSVRPLANGVSSSASWDLSTPRNLRVRGPYSRAAVREGTVPAWSDREKGLPHNYGTHLRDFGYRVHPIHMYPCAAARIGASRHRVSGVEPAMVRYRLGVPAWRKW